MSEEKNLAEVVAKLKLQLMRENGVEAVGESIADGAPCLKIYFRDDESLARAKIADSLQGVAIVKVVTGSIEAQ